jgi:uncharacterized protein YkwD
MRALAAAVVCLLLAASAADADGNAYARLLAPPGACGAAADQLNLELATARAAMLCLTNYARAHAGLRPLEPNTLLEAAGNAKLGADLSCKEFSHTPCGNPFQRVFTAYLAGATAYRIGENIAWGTGGYGTPRSTMDSWLNSPGHRENILDPSFTELGVGYLTGETFQGWSGATLWSQEFGEREPARKRG